MSQQQCVVCSEVDCLDLYSCTRCLQLVCAACCLSHNTVHQITHGESERSFDEQVETEPHQASWVTVYDDAEDHEPPPLPPRIVEESPPPLPVRPRPQSTDSRNQNDKEPISQETSIKNRSSNGKKLGKAALTVAGTVAAMLLVAAVGHEAKKKTGSERPSSSFSSSNGFSATQNNSSTSRADFSSAAGSDYRSNVRPSYSPPAASTGVGSQPVSQPSTPSTVPFGDTTAGQFMRLQNAMLGAQSRLRVTSMNTTC